MLIVSYAETSAPIGSFASGADRYDRLRPEAPSEAVDFCVPLEAADVVDIGAGTGKLTSALLAHGHRVVAVEPSASMREQLALRLPSLTILDTRAEATGLADRSVDVATFAQSWHWVDVPAASQEVARIVRPGGYLSMLWTMLDEEAPWVSRLQKAMHSLQPTGQSPGTPGEGDELWEQQPPGPFEPRQRHTHSWSQSMTRADLRDLVTTRSYYLESAAPEQAALVRAVGQAITADWPELNDDDVLDLPHVTTVLRYRRTP
ncbi:MAG: class I SAM-dependent methyltransferase [Ornithinimicrobium sp.]